MKKPLMFLITAAAAVSLTACAPSEPAQTTEPPTASTGAPPATESTTVPETIPETSVPETSESVSVENQALTAEELAAFQELFGTPDLPAGTTWYSQALTSYFEKPEDVDLHQLFYNGNLITYFGQPDAPVHPTDEEMAWLLEKYGEDDFRFHVDCGVISRSEMEDVMIQVFGMTVGQTNEINLDAFDHYPDTNRYFIFRGDTNAQLVTLTDGKWIDNKTVELHYPGPYLEECTVVMRCHYGAWYVYSNATSMPAES